MSADVELLRMPHTRLDLAFRADKHVILSVERRGVGGLCFAHVLTTVSDLPLASSYLRCLFTTPSLVFGMRPFRHPDRPIRSGNSFSGIILSE